MAQNAKDTNHDGFSEYDVGISRPKRKLPPEVRFNLAKRRRQEGAFVEIVVNGQLTQLYERDIPPGYHGSVKVIETPS